MSRKMLFIVLLCLCCCVFRVAGQMVSGCSFLQGAYIEIAIAPNGSLGGWFPPAGYHAFPTADTLGIRYDWGHDGWGVGTSPDFGDYTTNGTPYEGWAIEFNGVRRDAFYTSGGSIFVATAHAGVSFTGGLSGSNVSHGIVAHRIESTWEGACDGLFIRQRHTLDTFGSWFVNTITFVNTTNTTISDAYYFRGVDPDGTQPTSGSFNTLDTIKYQNDSQCRVMLVTRAPSDPRAYLSLAAKDYRAKAVLYREWAPYLPVAAKLSRIYDGTALGLGWPVYHLGGSQNGDYGSGIVFRLGDITAGDSAVFSYAYILGENSGIDSAFPGTVSSCSVTPITGAAQMCIGQTAKLNCSTPGGIWSVSNPAVATISSSGDITTVGGGIVVITYNVGAGRCQSTHTIVAGSPLVTPGIDVCAGSDIRLSTFASGGRWTSTNTTVATVNTATGVVKAINEGVAVIFYEWPAGCISTNSVVVHPSVLPPIVGPARVCVGASITLSNAVAGGSWTSIAPALANIALYNPVVWGISSGNTTIVYETICARVTTPIAVDKSPVIYGPSAICAGSTRVLSTSSGGGVWSSNDMLVATITATGSITGVAAGASVISYNIPDGCTGTSLLTVSGQPGAITGNDSVCIGSSLMLNNAVPGGVWLSSNNFFATVSGSVVTGVSAGQVMITYSSLPVVDGTCMATKTIAVVPLPFPGVIEGPRYVCSGTLLQLSASVSGGTWSSDNSEVVRVLNVLSGNMQAVSEGIVEMSYYVTGANACVGRVTHFISVLPRTFTTQASVIQISCYGAKDGGIAISATGDRTGYQYIWSTGETTPSIMALGAGSYSVTVSDPGIWCLVDTLFIITQPESIQVKDSSVADLCGRGTGALLIQVSGGVGGYSYLWSTNESSEHLEQLHAGIYSVTVTDANNCKEEHIATVADSACSDIVIHDVITPNGDGINDVWVIEGIRGNPGCMVQVFDKWGDKVFEQKGYNNDWHGKGASGLLPGGTYYYIVRLNVVNASGSSNVITGSLLIKR